MLVGKICHVVVVVAVIAAVVVVVVLIVSDAKGGPMRQIFTAKSGQSQT